MIMEFHDDKLLPYFIGLENEIQTNLETLTLNTIHRAEERLYSIISQLNSIRNSRIAVNKMIPDVFYNIFTLAIYSSERPDKTALAISRVCRHWRNLALGWPNLWGFLSLSGSPSVAKLFTSRSKNTPLWLSWIMPYISDTTKSYFKSCTNLILPRLCSLTLHISRLEHLEIQHMFRDPQSPPLRLQHLDFKLSYDGIWSHPGVSSLTVTDFMRLDISCLRELKLEGTDLPWLQLPHNKLTHFKLWHPITPPALSQLLDFLSNCPLLCELEFGMSGDNDVDTSTNSSMTNRLDFPSLKKLKLVLGETTAMSNFDYLQKLSACIQTSGSLSQFELSYSEFFDEDLGIADSLLPFNIFGPVPSGTFSHFGGNHYLSINIKAEGGYFRIYSARSVPLDHLSSYSLILSGIWPSTYPLNRAPILELMRAMPEITHLALYLEAWEILASWDVDLRDVFPCLNTLELLSPLNSDDLTWVLNSLPGSLQLKTLVLTDVYGISSHSEALFDAVLRTGAEALELFNISNSDNAGLSDVVATLRQIGIKVSISNSFR